MLTDTENRFTLVKSWLSKHQDKLEIETVALEAENGLFSLGTQMGEGEEASRSLLPIPRSLCKVVVVLT